jgi:hypothetical protein
LNLLRPDKSSFLDNSVAITCKNKLCQNEKSLKILLMYPCSDSLRAGQILEKNARQRKE